MISSGMYYTTFLNSTHDILKWNVKLGLRDYHTCNKKVKQNETMKTLLMTYCWFASLIMRNGYNLIFLYLCGVQVTESKQEG